MSEYLTLSLICICSCEYVSYNMSIVYSIFPKKIKLKKILDNKKISQYTYIGMIIKLNKVV